VADRTESREEGFVHVEEIKAGIRCKFAVSSHRLVRLIQSKTGNILLFNPWSMLQ
jgi:hypothetical protein